MTKAWPCLLAIAILLLSPLLAEANGGTIQVASHPTGPYLLTVFTSPNPIRVGTVDVSVLMQEAGGETVENALVRVTARPVDREGEETIYEATHDMATNKLYYAAHAELPEAGQWLISVHVAGDRGEGAVEFQVEATQAGLLDSPLGLVGLLTAPLLLIAGGWALAKRRAARGDPS